MEYVDGPTLGEELAAGLTEAEVALIGAQLLTALLALHGKGIAHVCLSPAGVVLRDLRPVLIDFGSARRIGSEPAPSALPIGTPGYAAPELATGEPISAGMDLYALGAILYEAVTGRPTFEPTCPAPERPYTHEALTTLAAAVPDDFRPWPA